MIRWYRSAGFWSLAIAVVHLVSTPILYPRSTASMLDGSPVGIVDRDASLFELRGASFWFLMAGLFQLGTALVVWQFERETGRAPVGFPAFMLAFGVVGAVLSQVSGFWVYLGIGLLARHNAKAAGSRGTSGTQPAQRHTGSPVPQGGSR